MNKFETYKMGLSWYNYKKEKYEYLDEKPEDYADYIPQIPAAQGLYRVHIAMGKSPLIACKDTLLACAGIKDEDEHSS